MIVYISTEMNSQLLNDADIFVKPYIKWQYDIGNFIKEEYANILSIHPDAIVIDYMAVENISRLPLMKDAFPDVKFILIADEENLKQLDQMEGWDIVTLNSNSKNKILEIIYSSLKKDIDAKEIKIGIVSDKNGVGIEVAFNLLECILNYTDDICCIEVSEKSALQDYEKKFGLIKKDDFYEYKQVPILFNMVKSGVKISIFLFSGENRKIFEKCDYPLELKEDNLIFKNDAYYYPKLRDPINDDRTYVYKEIFGTDLGFEIKSEANAEETKKKTEVYKTIIRNHAKYGILIFVLSALFIVFIIFLCTNVSNGKPDELVTKEMTQNSENITTFEEVITTNVTTITETTTEVQTVEEITTKKAKKKKKINTETQTKKEAVTTTRAETVTTKKEQQTTKKSKPKKRTTQETTKPKENNTVPSYSENNGVIGSANMSLVRNTVMSNMSGTYNSNMTNLAIYMAKNGLSNAQTAVENVCGYTTLKCSARTATATSPSTDSEDILDAATKLAEKLSGTAGTYGIGINASFKNGRYYIYVVVVTKK